MNKFFLILIIAPFAQKTFAQGTLQGMGTPSVYAVSSVTGVPFRETGASNEFSGSIYLFDEWKPASVVLSDGNEYEVSKLKFDELRNKFLFNRNDTIYEFADNVRQIKFKASDDKDMIFEKVINANDKISAGTFVQVLSSGKVTLLKQFKKAIEGENTTNGMFSSTKQVVSHIIIG